jgi:hypothetical protein
VPTLPLGKPLSQVAQDEANVDEAIKRRQRRRREEEEEGEVGAGAVLVESNRQPVA